MQATPKHGETKDVTLSRVEYDLMRLEANQLALIQALKQRGILDDGATRSSSSSLASISNLDLLVGCRAGGCDACHKVSGYHDDSGAPINTAAGFDPRSFGLPTNEAEAHAMPCDFKMPAACHANTSTPSGCVGVKWQNDAVQKKFTDACRRAQTQLDTVCRHAPDGGSTVSTARTTSK